MTKKNVIIGVCLGLALIGAIALAFVLPSHEHSYNNIAPYTIEDNKAYENKKCSCGDVQKVELTNYVIVNTETAQEALDNAADGITIVLNSGNYGRLYLRKNATSVNVPSTWAGGADATFKRTINGLTIIGTEGTNLTGLKAEAGTYAATEHSLSATHEYLNMYIEIKNLVIKNIKFTPAEKEVAVNLANAGQKVSIDGLTIDGCTVDGTNSTIDAGNRLFQSEALSAIEYNSTEGLVMVANRKNITISNCVMNNLHQGIKINFVENLTIKSNQFKNIKGRDMLIGGGTGVISGNILIEANTSDGSTERFIRMAGLAGNLTVKDNVVTNNNGADKDIVKVTASGTSEYTFSGNNWEGKDDAQAFADGVINYPQQSA